MGISNLLPLLEKSTRRCNVSEFRGLTVAVDSYCWLHKGARSCALQLAKGEPTDMYVTFCMKYVNMLLSYDIKPIMVFDGRRLPAKLQTEAKRSKTKKNARKQAMELLRLGKMDEAYKFFKQCIDVTPEMALALMKECRKTNVDCIVAPYESDAQLAFFSLNRVAQCIISEDSDLLVFGCQKVLYKMDLTGSGQLVEADKINLSLKMRPDHYTFEKFRHLCILSGCDYIDSLPGVGLKKALKFMAMTAEENPEIFLDRIPRYLNLRNLVVTQEYKESFLTADATFKHQTVYDPINKKLVPLTPIQTKITYCRNAGLMFEPEVANQLCLGNINPSTMEKINNWQPILVNSHSIWSNCYTPRPLKTISNSEPKPKKAKTLSNNEIDRINAEYDDKISKELEFYKKKVPVQTESHSTQAEPESETSPVLGNTNPFIKKKLSKFNITNVDPAQKLVRSRFFSTTLDSCEEEVESQDNMTDTDHALLAPPDEYMDIAITNGGRQFEEAEIENLSLHTHEENCDDAKLSQASDIENSSPPLDDDIPDLPLIECECILEIDDTEILPEDPTFTSLENLPDEPLAKRKRMEPVGTKKHKKKQATIMDMFKKMSPK